MSYKQRAAESGEQAAPTDPKDEVMPCRFCESGSDTREMLSMHGAMCRHCYGAWLRRASDGRRVSASEGRAALRGLGVRT